MTTYTIIDDGASRSGSFHCYKIEASSNEVEALAVAIKDMGGVRYVDACKLMERVTFEATPESIARIRKRFTAPKRRRLVEATVTADQMGDGFDGFGKSWRLGEGDACVYGLPPEAEGDLVKYAYFN